MTPFVVAAFSDRQAAEAAGAQLRGSGLSIRDVQLHESTSDVTNAAALEIDELVSGGFFENGRKLLDQLLGTPPSPSEAADYADMVQREATLLSVHVDTPEIAREVADRLTADGARRVATLPQPGLET
jgi:hypothetical protein